MEDLVQAVRAEVMMWPLAEAEIEAADRPDAMRVELEFCGKTGEFSFTSSSTAEVVVAETARIFKSLGAVRSKPKDQAPGTAAAMAKASGGVIRAARPAGPGIAEEGEYDLDDDVYHADPCAVPSCSASLLKVMIKRTPWHAWHAHPRLNHDFEDDSHKKFDLGSTFHKEILGKGTDLAVLPYADWRKKEANEARAEALANGLQPVLQDQYDRAVAMAAAARRQMKRWPELAMAMAGGIPERTLIWREDNGVWCRAKLDWQPHGGVLFPDWKSTAAGAGPDEWGQRVMWDTGCDIQDAFYRRGIRKVLGREAALIFGVVETDEPHAMMAHRITPAAAAMADRKVEWGIRVFGMCLEAQRWPGYPGDVAWNDPPPWQERKWMDREENGLTDPGFMAAMIEGVHTVPKRDASEIIADDRADGFGLLPVGEGGTSDEGN